MAVIVVLALAARLIVIAGSPTFTPTSDSADYDRIAVSLADHGNFPPSLLLPRGGPSAFRAPLFPISLGAVYKVAGTSSVKARWEAGRLFEAVLGAIAVALICLIAVRLWGARAALISGAIAVAFPPLLLVGSSLMTESLFIPLVLAAVLAALVQRDSRHRLWWAVVSGVLVGCAALTRGNGIVLVLPVAFLVWNDRPRLSWASLRGPLLVLAATGLMLVPWTIRNARVLHAFVPISTEGGYALIGTYNTNARVRKDYPAMWSVPPVLDTRRKAALSPGDNEAEVSDRLAQVSFDYIRDNPSYLFTVAYWDTVRMLGLTGVGVERFVARYEAYPMALTDWSVYGFWIIAPLAVAGAFTRAARRAPAAFWACPLVLVLSSLMFAGVTRYRSPADPFIVMAAALGVIAVWQRARSHADKARPVGVGPARVPSPPA